MNKSAIFAGAAVAGLLAASGAAHAGPSVKIRDAVARVVVVPEARPDIDVEISGGAGSGLPELTITRQPTGRVVIDGRLDRKIRGCSGVSENDEAVASPLDPPAGLEVKVKGVGDVAVASAPLITIRAPMDVDIEAGGAVFGSIGRADAVELASAGCGDWTVANVAGGLDIAIAGSGDVRAGTSQSLEVSVAGSGDVTAGATRSLDASVAGSGDIAVARVDGPIEASIAGSGDIRIDAGESPKLEASIAGSGDIRFDGEARDVSASVLGSGDVTVRSVSGSLEKSVMGSGEIVVGD